MMPSGPRTKARRSLGLGVSGPMAISAPCAQFFYRRIDVVDRQADILQPVIRKGRRRHIRFMRVRQRDQHLLATYRHRDPLLPQSASFGCASAAGTSPIGVRARTRITVAPMSARAPAKTKESRSCQSPERDSRSRLAQAGRNCCHQEREMRMLGRRPQASARGR